MRRPSRQHIAIQSAIDTAGRPLTLGEIHAAVKAAVPEIGIATIYRSLKRLLGEQRIHEVALPGEQRRYAVARASSEPAYYFHCTVCDTILDMGACPKRVGHLAPRGFSTSRYELTLYGRCATCQRTTVADEHKPAIETAAAALVAAPCNV